MVGPDGWRIEVIRHVWRLGEPGRPRYRVTWLGRYRGDYAASADVAALVGGLGRFVDETPATSPANEDLPPPHRDLSPQPRASLLASLDRAAEARSGPKGRELGMTVLPASKPCEVYAFGAWRPAWLRIWEHRSGRWVGLVAYFDGVGTPHLLRHDQDDLRAP